MSPPRPAWRPVVHRVVSHPVTGEVLEASGFHTMADHADRIRSGRDVLAVSLPSGAHSVRRRRIKLLRRHGTDQAAAAMADGGWRGYEPPLPDVLLRSVRRYPGAVLDVGANTGLYSLIAARARPGVTVHAFEALPPVAAMLEENIALNRVGARVRVNRLAAADRSARLRLHVPVPTGATVETSASLDPEFKGGGGTTLEVEATTLDAYWDSVGRPPLSVMKVDTEGTEHLVLQGARRLLAAARPVVFFEFLERGAGPVLDALGRELGLVDVRMSPEEGVVGDSVRYHPRAWNHVFVPVEAVAAFGDIMRDSGLVVTFL